MKRLILFLGLSFFCFSTITISQSISSTKGKAIKHATIDISSLKQESASFASGIKMPNPHWAPKTWTHSESNIIFMQEQTYHSANATKRSLSSPPPQESFAGLMDNGNSIPPDVNGAAGPNHLMQTLNTDVRISDKEGNSLFQTSLNNWWDPMPGNGGSFDPKIVYDQYAERWIMTTPSGGNSTDTKIYFAVSTTSNPLDDWNYYYINTDPENILWFDYPNLGFNKNWISVGGIMRNSAFEAVEFVVFTLDKMAAYNGEEEPTLNRFTTTIGSAIVPASTYDANTDELYLISTGNGNTEGYGYINLFEISGPTETPTMELKGSIGIPEPWENWSYENHGDFLPQLGSSEMLNSIDARMQTMIYRNNKLWAVHHIYLPADDPTHTAIQWINLNTEGVILDRGRIEDSNQDVSFAFPSIAVNSREDILIGHGVFSADTYASSAYSFRDNQDEMGTMRDHYTYKQGLAPYYKTFGGDRNRWGDYSAVSVDPVHDIDFWVLHEYAELPSSSDQWGTWWAFVKPSFEPIADFEADNILIPVGETVNFNDLTLGIPNQWDWSFENGTPANSSLQNPEDILFDQEGSFDVQLTVTNDHGTDIISKENMITTSYEILPEVDFISNKKVVCVGNEVLFQDKSLYSPNQWEWQFDPSDVSFVNSTNEFSQNPEVIFNVATAYSVTLKAWNLNGNSEITKFEMIYAGGYPPYFKETFEEDVFVEDEWLIENPDNDVTWELYEVGGTTPGNRAMAVDFSTYFIGKRDRLISPPFNLENLENSSLEFQHAYAKKYPPLTDSLIIYVSTDCGENWTREFYIGEDGSGNFATHEITNNFWPLEAGDWCFGGWGGECISLDLNAYTGQSNVKVAFESYSSIGNPLFIDNISVSQYVGIEEKTKSEEMLVFPNPNNGDFTILLTESDEFIEMKLLNQMGQIVYSKKLNSNTKKIDIHSNTDWPQGTYILTLIGKEVVKSKKVVIQ